MIDQKNWSILNGNTIENQHDDKHRMKVVEKFSAISFYQWFHLDQNEVSRLYAKIATTYVVLRKSVSDNNMIVKSVLTIEIDEEKDTIVATHVHVDRHNVTRRSKGFVMSIVRNIYIFMQIEDGEGMDVISLKEPVQKDFVKIMGFMTTINTDRKLLSARVFLERNDEIWENIDPRFNISALSAYPEKQEFINQLLDKETSLTIPNVDLK